MRYINIIYVNILSSKLSIKITNDSLTKFEVLLPTFDLRYKTRSINIIENLIEINLNLNLKPNSNSRQELEKLLYDRVYLNARRISKQRFYDLKISDKINLLYMRLKIFIANFI